jgi:uncharacterized protein (TIGR02001 family)
MLKKTLLSAAALAFLAGGAVTTSAEESITISGNVALTSDYRFRGISQSDEELAIQGGFDLEHESGFYLGTWGSSVDFDTNGPCCDGSLELDVYAGFAGAFNEDWGYDVGFMAYLYPGDSGDEGDYYEIYGSISWKDLTVGGAYSDDYYAETDEFFYLYADYSFALPNEFALDLHVGANFLEEDGGFLSSDEDQYIDYSVSISRDWMGLNWALAWIGTDLDDDDVFGTDWADDTAVFTLSRSL